MNDQDAHVLASLLVRLTSNRGGWVELGIPRPDDSGWLVVDTRLDDVTTEEAESLMRVADIERIQD